MASETDFLNDALGQIGASRITAIDDGSTEANHCLTFYPDLRRAGLSEHTWNFAEGRVELAQEAAPPIFGYTFSYPLPSDYLRMKEYNGANTDLTLTLMQTGYFKIEGSKLLTNDGSVKIVYVRDVINPALWSPLFYQYLATRLASKLAGAIPKNIVMSTKKLEEAMGLLGPLALAVDGQESVSTPYIVDDLTWGR